MGGSPDIDALALALCLTNEGTVMPIIETSTDALLQKLIDDAVDEVCAEYDECRSIQTRAVALMDNGDRREIKLIAGSDEAHVVALMDDGKRRKIKLTNSSGLFDLNSLLAGLNRALASIGVQGRTTIIYFRARLIDDMVVIFAETRGRTTMCVLFVHRKTGKSGDDIILATHFLSSDCVNGLCRPTAWAGQICAFDPKQCLQLRAS